MSTAEPADLESTTANPEHLARLKKGVVVWNQWMGEHPEARPDLTMANLNGANLSKAYLIGANLSRAYLIGANLSAANLGASLFRANLIGANLIGANLSEANLIGADLREAKLREARLIGANLYKAKLREANLSGAVLYMVDLSGADLYKAKLLKANLTNAILIKTNLEGANLTACSVYGISAWNVRLKGAVQSNLIITPEDESPIQVDNLEVAQFIYLLLNNEKIRDVIDTITSKVVLILGRFTLERRVVLDAIREELRRRHYLPVLFDFEGPKSQTTVETISTLAHMARFVLADLTDAKSVLQELQAIVPLSPSVVVQPLLLASQEEPGMFDYIRKFPWVLDTCAWRIVISPATGHVAMFHALSCLTSCLSPSNWMLLILKAPRLR